MKVANGVSSTAKICCGCPQGTVSGPNNFKMMINDLCFLLSYIKYVDDTSVVSMSKILMTRPYRVHLMILLLGVL